MNDTEARNHAARRLAARMAGWTDGASSAWTRSALANHPDYGRDYCAGMELGIRAREEAKEAATEATSVQPREERLAELATRLDAVKKGCR